jgi:hypothetical protein
MPEAFVHVAGTQGHLTRTLIISGSAAITGSPRGHEHAKPLLAELPGVEHVCQISKTGVELLIGWAVKPANLLRQVFAIFGYAVTEEPRQEDVTGVTGYMYALQFVGANHARTLLEVAAE